MAGLNYSMMGPNFSPVRANASMMMPPNMMPFGPGPIMAPHFEHIPHATMTPVGNQNIVGATPFGAFSTISEPGLTAATSQASLHFDETEKKNKARIELLEKKIRVKDQLFDDALASTVASACACGQGTTRENKSLTAELKKRFLRLKGKYADAEAEIERLTKTVKIVEVEVREDTEPFREEIQKLKDERFDL